MGLGGWCGQVGEQMNFFKPKLNICSECKQAQSFHEEYRRKCDVETKSLEVRLADTQHRNGNNILRAERAEDQVAELEERLGDANTMLEKCNSQFIVELEAENAALREAVGTMLSRLEQRGFNNEDVLFLDLNTIYHAARKK